MRESRIANLVRLLDFLHATANKCNLTFFSEWSLQTLYNSSWDITFIFREMIICPMRIMQKGSTCRFTV